METEYIDNYSSDEEVGFNKEIDMNTFYRDYNQLKKSYKTKPLLSKYEKTRILSERSQQLANGAPPYLSNPHSYNSIYEVAIEELNQKKIPFIVQRRVSSENIELWKLEDLKII